MLSFRLSETLHAVDPEYQPVFLCVKAPLEYVSYVQNCRPMRVIFLFKVTKKPKRQLTPRWAPRRAHLRARVRDYRKRELLLFEVGP